MRSMSMLNSVVMVFDNVNPCLVLTVCVFVSSYNCHLRCSFAVLKLKMGIFEIIIVFQIPHHIESLDACMKY